MPTDDSFSDADNPFADFLISPTGPLYGVYRGIVVGLDDPDAHNRYQVHVVGVDSWFSAPGVEEALTRDKLVRLRDMGATIPPSSSFPGSTSSSPSGSDPRNTFANYPWAELICHAPKGNGDLPYYSIGDPCLVMFEGGSRYHRFIIGAWLSQSMGINDNPADRAASYPESRSKWIRYDWAANNIEQSALGDQSWVRISSGFPRLEICKLDNSVRIDCGPDASDSTGTAGTFGVEAGVVSIRGGLQGVFVSGDDVFLQASGDGDGPSIGHGTGAAVGLSQAMLGLYSNWDSDWYAQDEMWAGQYLDRKKIAGLRQWHQTRLMTITPKRLILGYTCTSTKLNYNSLNPADNAQANNTLSIDVEAQDYVIIKAGTESLNPDDPLSGLIGIYGFSNAELWAGNRIWIGQLQQGSGSSTSFCQTPTTILQGQYVYIGLCPDTSGPDNPYTSGSKPTCRVEVSANDLVRIRTCGANGHGSGGSCPDDPGMAITPIAGDIVINAENDLWLVAGRQVRISGANYPAPVYAVQSTVSGDDTLLQYSNIPCTPYTWTTFATITPNLSIIQTHTTTLGIYKTLNVNTGLVASLSGSTASLVWTGFMGLDSSSTPIGSGSLVTGGGFTTLQVGTGLTGTDEGGGVIRIDAIGLIAYQCDGTLIGNFISVRAGAAISLLDGGGGELELAITFGTGAPGNPVQSVLGSGCGEGTTFVTAITGLPPTMKGAPSLSNCYGNPLQPVLSAPDAWEYVIIGSMPYAIPLYAL